MKETDEMKPCARYVHAHTSQVLSVHECLKLNVIVFNMSSRVHISTHSFHKRLLMPYSLTVFPSGTRLEIECISETEMLLLFFDRLDSRLNKAISDFRRKSSDCYGEESFPCMKMDLALRSFTASTIDVYQEYLSNPIILENKFSELAFILINMHPIEEVFKFLSPLYGDDDLDFRICVLNQFVPVHNVKTLANSCGYPLRTFTHKFRVLFGVSPGDWIREQRKKNVKDLLSAGVLTFKNIAEELGMSSQQQLSRFCKREFGMTPTEIARSESSRQ